MTIRTLFALLLASAVVLPTRAVRPSAQGGDQSLDGIGETGLTARYVLGSNAEDSSRNNFHAALRGSGGAFVEDSRFGRALQLTGNGSYVQLPGQALNGEDTISVTAWVFLASGASGTVFDFGQDAATRFLATAGR